MPVAAWTEEEGTYTNYQSRVQAALQAINPPGDAQPAWSLLAALLEASGDTSVWSSSTDILSDMKQAVPAFAGIDLDSVYSQGALISTNGAL